MQEIDRQAQLPESAHTPDLAQQLRELPQEAFTRMRILQPETGCGNGCPDCSQLALPEIWSLTPNALIELMTEISWVAKNIGEEKNMFPVVGSGRTKRPDTIFPYLDNEIGSYPYLDIYLKHLRDGLGRKAKITTIGWSRKNQQLQHMHEIINSNYRDALSAVSFSLTSYTLALRRVQKGTTPENYKEDFANALRTYKPAIERLGTGKESGCVTLRFKPLICSSEEKMDDEVVNGYHLIHYQSYLLIGKNPGLPPTSEIDRASAKLAFTAPGVQYLVFVSDKHLNNPLWKNFASEIINGLRYRSSMPAVSEEIFFYQSDLYSLVNKEGSYYALDPDFTADGSFDGKYFYPRTEQRKHSGYNDSERFFLNTLINYKKSLGYSATDRMPNAQWSDVDNVIDLLSQSAKRKMKYDKKAGQHINLEIIPLIVVLKNALRSAGYHPGYFFDPGFTVDTGQILNQGRAISDFKGLTSTSDLALNPQHVRTVGTWENDSVWRWSVAPFATSELSGKVGKNVVYPTCGIVVQELNPANLSNYTDDGEKLREYFIALKPGSVYNIRQRVNILNLQRIPGIRSENSDC